MSKKKVTNKQKVGKTSFLKDERFAKIIGTVCLFFSLYLFIAMLSYLTTWKDDQDKVLQFSWSIIFQGDLTVENWLGRLGAFLSNSLIYWGFGLSSFLIVPVLAKLGVTLIKRTSIKSFLLWLRNSIVIMAFFSVLLEFTFRNSSFTWGGIFGTSVTLWLINFIGQLGLLFLLTSIVATIAIWYFNPNFNQINFALPNGMHIKLPNFPSLSRNERDSEPVRDDNRAAVSLEPTFAKAFGRTSEPRTDFRGNRPQTDSSSMELELSEDFPKDKKAEAVSDDDESLNLEITTPSHSSESLHEEFNSTLDPLTQVVPSIPNIDHSEPYDPTLDLSSYKPPLLEYLESYEDQKVEIDRAELESNKDQIIETLLNYKIEITKIRATIGPTVTLYEIIPAPGVKISKIKNLEDDIALSLSALGIRIIAPIPGKGTIGIEVPNKNKQIVSLHEVLNSGKFQNAQMDLPIALGKTINNEVFVADLAKMPHLLVAGATGQGKSVGINTILMSLLYKKHPSQVKLVLIDPKKVELFPYASLMKHFLAFLPNEDEPIVTETKKVIYTLNSLCIEMDERYDLLKKARTRNIKEYNEKFVGRKLNPQNGHKFMPFIVLVIDEFADLIMTAGKEVELPISRLAQLARAVGIHLIIATQRPSVNIITGVIKANFPARLAFKVTSKIDSRTILDGGGADQLIGRGDMLLSVGGNVVRLQCAFVDTPEVEKVISHIGDQRGYATPYYLPEFSSDEDSSNGDSGLKYSDLDDMFEDAASLIVANQVGSTSMIQRKLQLGYNRAGRIMDQLEALGIVGSNQGSKPREVIIQTEVELMEHLDHFRNK